MAWYDYLPPVYVAKKLGIVGPAAGKVDTSAQNSLATSLGAERQNYQGMSPPRYGELEPEQTRNMQLDQLAGLQAAANGTAPSAAELQLQKQSGLDAARQYGLAAALRGRSVGGALAAGTEGAANVAANTNQQAAILRAQEQANARQLLAGTLGGLRTADQQKSEAIAQLAEHQRRLDEDYRKALLAGQVSTLGGVNADNIASANNAQQQQGAYWNLAGAGLAGSLRGSDAAMKTDVKSASLADAIADTVHGVTFTYKPGHEDEGRHFGVVAQDLERVMPGVVVKGRDGLRRVDTGHLSLANTGLISEMARRIRALEAGA